MVFICTYERGRSLARLLGIEIQLCKPYAQTNEAIPARLQDIETSISFFVINSLPPFFWPLKHRMPRIVFCVFSVSVTRRHTCRGLALHYATPMAHTTLRNTQGAFLRPRYVYLRALLIPRKLTFTKKLLNNGDIFLAFLNRTCTPWCSWCLTIWV